MNNKELVVIVLAATLSKIRLTQLSKAELEARKMNVLKGGAHCGGIKAGDCGFCSSETKPSCADLYTGVKECLGY